MSQLIKNNERVFSRLILNDIIIVLDVAELDDPLIGKRPAMLVCVILPAETLK